MELALPFILVILLILEVPVGISVLVVCKMQLVSSLTHIIMVIEPHRLTKMVHKLLPPILMDMVGIPTPMEPSFHNLVLL